VEGLREAITNYEEKHGLVVEKVPTTLEVIRRRLKNVLNPLTGLDIVRTNLVTEMGIKDGVVTISIDLPEDHQFANNIRDEIKEKIETLWDVTRVDLVFKKAP
jgi:metal-sulfur cluster biosynthetic enzyme